MREMIRKAPDAARARLMATVSAAVLVGLLAGAPAAAQEPDAASYWVLELEGGVPLGDRQLVSELVPPGLLTISGSRPDFTIGGRIGVVTPMAALFADAGAGWDAGIFARFSRSNNASARGFLVPGTYYYFPYYGAVSSSLQETRAMIDFEARRDVGLGLPEDVDLTVIAGLRFAFFDSDTNTSFNLLYLYTPTPYYSFNERRRSRFVGLGPTLGAEMRVDLGDGFALGFDARASVLFGRRTVKTEFGGLFGPIVTRFERSRFDVVPMVGGSAAISYDLGTSGATLSAGLRATAAFGIHNQRALPSGLTGIPGTGNVDRFTVTPFVRLTLPFGG